MGTKLPPAPPSPPFHVKLESQQFNRNMFGYVSKFIPILHEAQKVQTVTETERRHPGTPFGTPGTWWGEGQRGDTVSWCVDSYLKADAEN